MSNRYIRAGTKRYRKRVGLLVGSAFIASTFGVVTPAEAAVNEVNGLRGDYFLTSGSPDYELEDLQSSVHDGELEFNDLVPVYEEQTGQGEHTGARWTGDIEVPESGEYKFHVTGDNGFKLWIDDEQLIDWWENDWDKEQSSSEIALEAGEKYSFRLDQFQDIGGANLFVRWEGPGIDKEIVPITAFTPPEDFDVYRASGVVRESGEQVDVDLDGVVEVDESLTENLTFSVDGGEIPVSNVEIGEDGESIAIAPEGPIAGGGGARLIYNGDGGLSVSGDESESFDIPLQNLSEYVMLTPWAEDVDSDNPLPEYPRPTMERDDWENLNGPWELEILEEDSPTEFGEAYSDEIIVPYPIESVLSEVQKQEQHFAYRKLIEVPEGWDIGNSQRLQLNFGAVDYEATVFVNGDELTHHVGGFDGFSVDATDSLVEGENEIVVRVADTTGDQPRGKQSNDPSGIFYTPASGIWQTVWMEPTPASHIEKVDTTPDLDSESLLVNVEADEVSSGAEIEARAIDADGNEVGSVTGTANEELELSIAEPNLWSPEDPYLYDLEVDLVDGEQTDSVNSYFGMRSIEVSEIDGNQRILLNGEQTFLNSTLDQGYWPDGVYTAPTDEALAWDIQETKDLGFNTIRKHIKVEPERWYHHADEIGMMVWQDMPNGDNESDEAREQFRSELETMVDQFGHHTSIIGWIPFNEGWGEWDLDTTGEIADEVKEQDPSRLVNAHSGMNCCASLGDSGGGDIIDHHEYTGPALPSPDNDRAAIDGEHGGFSLSIPGHVWPGGSVNPYGEVDTSEELTAEYVKNTAKMIAPSQDFLSGSVYTQLTDLEGEVNGFWTYDRQIAKMDRDQVRTINEKLVEVGSQPRSFDEGSDDPLAYWPLDEGEGEVSEDVTGNGHDLDLGEGVEWEDEGIDGSAVKVSGEESATAEISGLDTTQDFSVSSWVRLDSLPDEYATAVSMDGLHSRSSFFLQYGSGIDGFAFSMDEDRATAEIEPELGEWHHLAGVHDAESSELRLYLDGDLAAVEDSKASSLNDGTVALGRGQWDGDHVDFLDGAIDETRLYNRALEDDEVSELAEEPSDLTEVTPEDVEFEDGTGSQGGTYTIPDVDGLEYLIEGEPVDPGEHSGTGKVTVTAEALDGYIIAEGSETEWSHTFSDDDGSGSDGDDDDGSGSDGEGEDGADSDGGDSGGSDDGTDDDGASTDGSAPEGDNGDDGQPNKQLPRTGASVLALLGVAGVMTAGGLMIRRWSRS